MQKRFSFNFRHLNRTLQCFYFQQDRGNLIWHFTELLLEKCINDESTFIVTSLIFFLICEMKPFMQPFNTSYRLVVNAKYHPCHDILLLSKVNSGCINIIYVMICSYYRKLTVVALYHPCPNILLLTRVNSGYSTT